MATPLLPSLTALMATISSSAPRNSVLVASMLTDGHREGPEVMSQWPCRGQLRGTQKFPGNWEMCQCPGVRAGRITCPLSPEEPR